MNHNGYGSLQRLSDVRKNCILIPILLIRQILVSCWLLTIYRLLVRLCRRSLFSSNRQRSQSQISEGLTLFSTIPPVWERTIPFLDSLFFIRFLAVSFVFYPAPSLFSLLSCLCSLLSSPGRGGLVMPGSRDWSHSPKCYPFVA